MVKRITQFRYFGDGRNKVSYILVPTDSSDAEDGIISNTKYIDMVAKGELYKEENDEYVQVKGTEPQEPNRKYYKILEQLYNYPEGITKTNLASGAVFENFFPITKLGIQSIPGTRFRLNANLEWIILGVTGIYELDLTNSSASIISLMFDEKSLTNIQENENGYLIIDIMYEQEV